MNNCCWISQFYFISKISLVARVCVFLVYLERLVTLNPDILQDCCCQPYIYSTIYSDAIMFNAVGPL